MKRLVAAAFALALFGLAAPSVSSAQAIIVVGGGVTLPTGDYDTYAKPGWLAHAGVGFPVGDAGFNIGGHGYYGSNSHETEGDKTNLYGGLASVGMAFGDPEGVSPQVYGLVGSMTHSYKSDSFPSDEGSETALAAGVGAEIGFPLGSIMGNVGGFFLTGFSDLDGTHVFGIDIGVGIPVGGGM